MIEKIFKYELRIADRQFVMMPKGAEILHVHEQNDAVCLWALVNPSHANEERCFEVYGTGHLIHSGMGVDRKYLGTAHCGVYVWHVFERTN